MPQQQQKKPVSNTKAAPAAKPAATTEIRNSAVPPRTAAAPVAKKEISWNDIAQRAYFIWQTRGGSEMENWLQAERDLRSGR